MTTTSQFRAGGTQSRVGIPSRMHHCAWRRPMVHFFSARGRASISASCGVDSHTGGTVAQIPYCYATSPPYRSRTYLQPHHTIAGTTHQRAPRQSRAGCSAAAITCFADFCPPAQTRTDGRGGRAALRQYARFPLALAETIRGTWLAGIGATNRSLRPQTHPENLTT